MLRDRERLYALGLCCKVTRSVFGKLSCKYVQVCVGVNDQMFLISFRSVILRLCPPLQPGIEESPGDVEAYDGTFFLFFFQFTVISPSPSGFTHSGTWCCHNMNLFRLYANTTLSTALLKCCSSREKTIISANERQISRNLSHLFVKSVNSDKLGFTFLAM